MTGGGLKHPFNADHHVIKCEVEATHCSLETQEMKRDLSCVNFTSLKWCLRQEDCYWWKIHFGVEYFFTQYWALVAVVGRGCFARFLSNNMAEGRGVTAPQVPTAYLHTGNIHGSLLRAAVMFSLKCCRFTIDKTLTLTEVSDLS